MYLRDYCFTKKVGTPPTCTGPQVKDTGLLLSSNCTPYSDPLCIALAFKGTAVPYDQWGSLEVYFVDGDATNTHPGNIIVGHPKGGIPNLRYPGFFYIPNVLTHCVNVGGDVLNILSGNVMKFTDRVVVKERRDAYPQFNVLTAIGEDRILLHRALALAFLGYGADVDSTLVNHIDGRKWNSQLYNVEWCDHSGNISHAYDADLRSDNVPVTVREINTGVEWTFRSLSSCGEFLGMTGTAISLRLNKKDRRPFLHRFWIKYRDEAVSWDQFSRDASISGAPTEIQVRNIDSGEILTFGSMGAAARELNLKIGTISWLLRHSKTRKLAGWQIKYTTDKDFI